MRPLILGREFLFKNELKVYYSKTGECRLDHKQEELVATIDLQDELTLSLRSGIYVMPTGIEEAPKVALDIHCLQ